MNRLRLWLLVALLLLAGACNLFFLSSWLAARTSAQMDRDLRAAAAQLHARADLLAADAGDLAEAAAHAPEVASGLADGGADPLAAAASAIRPAAEALGAAPERILLAVSGPNGAAARAGGEDVALPDAPPFLADPQRGARRSGWARLGDGIWMVSGVPAARGGAVAVGLRVDAAFARSVKAATEVDVTVAGAGGAFGTLPADTAAALRGTALQPGRAVDVGAVGRVQTSLPAPPLPLLFAQVPAQRAIAVPLEGAKDAVAVLSVDGAPRVAGLVAYQWLAVGSLALFLLLGVVLGLLMTENGGPAIARELLSAADRIRKGDIAARAPSLAGSQGVLAAALNRAADAAEQGRARAAIEPAAEEPATTAPIFAAAAPAAAEPEPAASAPQPEPEPFSEFDESRPAHAAPPSPLAEPPPPAEAPAPAAMMGAAAEPAPLAQEPAEEPAPAYAAPAAPFEAPAPVPLPGPGNGVAEASLARAASSAEEDEAHWRLVFDDFLRVRGQTGEPALPVAYDRFREKLQRNRDQLVQKFGCRTVRFQVYVKDGKAAVRATPVR
jgi:hypothetical protein